MNLHVEYNCVDFVAGLYSLTCPHSQCRKVFITDEAPGKSFPRTVSWWRFSRNTPATPCWTTTAAMEALRPGPRPAANRPCANSAKHPVPHGSPWFTANSAKFFTAPHAGIASTHSEDLSPPTNWWLRTRVSRRPSRNRNSISCIAPTCPPRWNNKSVRCTITITLCTAVPVGCRCVGGV